MRALGGAVASASLLGVPLGHNSSFLQGPAFAPPRIREAIWCGSTNSSTEEGVPFKHHMLLLLFKFYITEDVDQSYYNILMHVWKFRKRIKRPAGTNKCW